MIKNKSPYLLISDTNWKIKPAERIYLDFIVQQCNNSKDILEKKVCSMLLDKNETTSNVS